MRRDFMLPELDTTYLDTRDLRWETITVDQAQWVFIHNFPIPDGYNVTKATVAIRISTGYPDAPLDMAYFNPMLTRSDTKAIGALSPIQIGNESFQQWSRHRSTNNPWIPGEDSLETHLMLVEHWLEREFLKN